MQNMKLHLLAGLRYTHSHLGHGTIVTGSHSAALRRVLYPRSLALEVDALTRRLNGCSHLCQSLVCVLRSGEWGLPAQHLLTGLRYMYTDTSCVSSLTRIRLLSITEFEYPRGIAGIGFRIIVIILAQMWLVLYCDMRTMSCNRRKLDARSQLGLTYTNERSSHSDIACAQTVCSRDLSMLEMIYLWSWIKRCQKLSTIQNRSTPDRWKYYWKCYWL